MALIFNPRDPDDRFALALILAGFICIVVAACGKWEGDSPSAAAAVADRAHIDPCTHKRGPEVCTTDDQGEWSCK